MELEEIATKVELYLKRASKGINSSAIINYPRDEFGYWHIISGTTDYYIGYRKPLNTVVQGRFIDAVAFAVQQPEFYSDHQPEKDPSIGDHGYVEKIDVAQCFYPSIH